MAHCSNTVLLSQMYVKEGKGKGEKGREDIKKMREREKKHIRKK